MTAGSRPSRVASLARHTARVRLGAAAHRSAQPAPHVQLQREVESYRTAAEVAELHAILDRYDDAASTRIRMLIPSR